MFVYISTVLFGVLFVIWNKSNTLNLLVKIMFFGVFVYGIIESLQQLGMLR